MDDQSIEKIIKLFTGPNSANLHDRHCVAIQRLCESSLDGFAVGDLPKVQHLFELTLTLLRSGIEGFLEPACALLKALSRPFAKSAVTDDVKLVGHIESILAAVGKALNPAFPSALQVSAAEMLRSFASGYGPRPNVFQLKTGHIGSNHDESRGSHQYFVNQRLIAQSQVSGALIQSLAAGLQASDPLIILSLSSTLLSFSYLPDGCKSLLDHHILTCLPHLLRLGYKHDVTGIAVEILWNLFEHAASRSEIWISEPHPTLSTLASNEEMGSEAVLTEPMASALSSLFTTVLLDGFRDSDKELRNNVLVVINLVLGCSQVFAVTCHLSGLFGATMAVSCAPECCNGAPYVKPWALSTDELDLELKLLCWTTATKSCVVLPEVLGLAESMGLMNLMMQHLDVTNPPPAVRRWSPDRASALRSAAISVLHQVSPISVSQFLCADGVNVVLSLIARCPVSCHVEAALNQLLALCTAVPEMAEELGSRSAFPTILSLIQVDSGWPDSLRQTALQLLSVMCSSSENKKRFRKAHGISVLVEQLGQISQLDATLPAPMALAVLNSVWCCIIPDRKNVARFLVSDGIDLLLNHLETGNRAHRSLVLSLLADLLENERVLPFFHEWRSNLNQVPAASLLIRFWKEEDSRRGITIDGVLTNTAQPLMGLNKCMAWVAPESVAYGNIAPDRRAQLLAITESCSGDDLLSKIYTVLKLVGMTHLDYLTLEDQASLCLVEKFVKFKQGDMWRKMKEEFLAEGVRPTAADRERIISGIELSESLALAVKEAQKQVLERHMMVTKKKESEFFQEMDDQRKLEKEHRFYQKDNTQFTVAELREAKMKKEQMLKNSHRLAQQEQMDDPLLLESARQSLYGP